MMKSKIFLAGIATTVMLAAPMAANASTLTLEDVANASGVVTVIDQGAGDANAAVGAVTFIGAVGAFNINVTTGLGAPILGNGINFAQIDLNFTTASSAAGELEMTFLDEGLSLSSAIASASFLGEIGGTAGSTVSAFAELRNTTSGLTTLIDLATFGPGAFSGSAADTVLGGLASTDIFALFAQINIVHDKLDSSSGNFEVTAAVPVPAALPLFATALLGLGLLGRRRVRRS